MIAHAGSDARRWKSLAALTLTKSAELDLTQRKSQMLKQVQQRKAVYTQGQLKEIEWRVNSLHQPSGPTRDQLRQLKDEVQAEETWHF